MAPYKSPPFGSGVAPFTDSPELTQIFNSIFLGPCYGLIEAIITKVLIASVEVKGHNNSNNNPLCLPDTFQLTPQKSNI